MPAGFVTKKTARLYEGSTGGAWRMVLIFGDEVETTGPPVNGRTPCRFRGRDGFITTTSLGNDRALEIYFIDVGQGDSTFIVTPGGKTILVDGGVDRRALGFLAWKYRLDDPTQSVDIDLLALSHADGDHIGGLIPIIEHPRIRVKRIVHSGIATFKTGQFATELGDLAQPGSEKFLVTRHDALGQLNSGQLSDEFFSWKRAIENENPPPVYGAVDSTSNPINLADPNITLEVLGPRLANLAGGQKGFPWFDNKAHTINGHSVVLRLTFDQISLLLSGDLNIPGSEHLLADPVILALLPAHIFKAPHHGSHEYHPPFIQAVRPQVSVISSGDEPDHGHPRAVFIGGVGKDSRSAAPLVFSTEIAATFVEVSGESVGGDTGEANFMSRERTLFKRRLHGMINVRSDGKKLYAARRVAAGYWWESYGPISPAP